MSSSVRMRPLAREDLAKIYKYSIQRFGTERAEKYIHDIDITFQKLIAKPSLGRDCNHIKPGLKSH